MVGGTDGSALASPQERTAVELQRLERIGDGWRIEDWGWRKVSEKMHENRRRLT